MIRTKNATIILRFWSQCLLQNSWKKYGFINIYGKWTLFRFKLNDLKCHEKKFKIYFQFSIKWMNIKNQVGQKLQLNRLLSCQETIMPI